MAEDRPGGEPTEEPTPRRVKQARERGQIARSGDLTGSLAFAAAVGALAAGGAAMLAELSGIFHAGIRRAAAGGTHDAGALLTGAAGDMALLAAPVLGAAAIVAGVAGYLQAGGLFTLKPLVPEGKRLNPLAGMGRMVSRQALGETLKAVVKLACIGAVAWATLAPHLGELPRLAGVPAAAAFDWTAAVAVKFALRVAILYAVIGAADYLWQRRRLRRELMMTREEVKREHKESEGDPRHKAERQRLHRDLLRHQMVQAVATADCVIVNPDHIAVALRWDEENMGAPQVVAKGERLVAEQIKDVARRHGVPIYRDVALARALNDLDLGDEIPEELYEAVAEVLRFAQRQAEGG